MNNLTKKAKQLIDESRKSDNKSFFQILWEIANYSSRLGLSPGEYFSYGFQLKSCTLNKILSYIPSVVHFTEHLAILNQTGKEILYDKLLFKEKMSEKNIPTPKTIGYIGPKSRNYISYDHITPTSIHKIFREKKITEFIIKPAKGIQGKGIFIGKHDPARQLPFSVKDLQFSTIEFFNFLRNNSNSQANEHVIIEELVKSPDFIKKISPDAAPNLRIVTLRSPDSKVNVTNTSIRLGLKNAVTSNAGSGGMIANINPETGAIISCKTSANYSGQFLTEHPDTKVSLIGFKIPFWREILDLCVRSALSIDSVNSIGWDVLITDHGPVILEGNDDWGIVSTQILKQGYLSPEIRDLLKQYGLIFPERELPKPSFKKLRNSLFGIS